LRILERYSFSPAPAFRRYVEMRASVPPREAIPKMKFRPGA